MGVLSSSLFIKARTAISIVKSSALRTSTGQIKRVDDTPAPPALPTLPHQTHLKPPTAPFCRFRTVSDFPPESLRSTGSCQPRFPPLTHFPPAPKVSAGNAAELTWREAIPVLPMHDSWVYGIQLFAETAGPCFEWTHRRIIIRKLCRRGGAPRLKSGAGSEGGKLLRSFGAKFGGGLRLGGPFRGLRDFFLFMVMGSFWRGLFHCRTRIGNIFDVREKVCAVVWITTT